MNKWILIALTAVLILFGCTANRAVPKNEETEPYTGIVTKVAILPLKTIDSSSRNIQKILTVRDFDYVFTKFPQYSLLNMDEVAKQFKMSGYKDVEDLEIEEMKELSEMIGCDILVMGSINSIRSDEFALSMRFFSAKTEELTPLDFKVTNAREQRWKTLETTFIAKLDDVVSNEVNKIYNIALNNYANGNYAEAEKNLVFALGLDPDLKDAYYYLGSVYYKQGKLEQAIQNLELNLEKNPQHTQTLSILIDIYEKTNQTAKRLNAMEKLATINENEELWLTIANLYSEQNNIAKAEEALQKALELNPNYIEAKTRLAFLLYDNNRFDEAIPYLEAIFDKYPENELVSTRLANAYQKANRTSDPAEVAAINKKAIDILNTLITNQPNNAIAYMNMAAIYLSQNKLQDAELYANKALQKDPTLYLPYIYLATISQSKGTNDYNNFIDLEKQAAKAVGKKASTLKTQRDNARNSAVNNFRKALEYLNNAKARTTDEHAITDINNRIARVNQLINQATATY